MSYPTPLVKSGIDVPFLESQNEITTACNNDKLSYYIIEQNRCLPEMIKLVHFNNKYSSNINIIISNNKNNNVLIYNDNKWMIDNKNIILEKYKNRKILQCKFIEWYYDKIKKEKYDFVLLQLKNFLEIHMHENLFINQVKYIFQNIDEIKTIKDINKINVTEIFND